MALHVLPVPTLILGHCSRVKCTSQKHHKAMKILTEGNKRANLLADLIVNNLIIIFIRFFSLSDSIDTSQYMSFCLDVFCINL